MPKISDLTEVTAPNITDVLPIVNGTTTKKITVANLIAWDVVKKTTADFAVTNASQQDVTELQFAVTAGEFWEVVLFGVASGTNSTCDAAVQLATTGTWSPTASCGWGVHRDTAGTLTNRTPAAPANAAYYFSGGTGLGVCNSSTKSPFELHFLFDAATSGTVKVQFGNASAGASWTSTLYKGAVLLARKIRIA